MPPTYVTPVHLAGTVSVPSLSPPVSTTLVMSGVARVIGANAAMIAATNMFSSDKEIFIRGNRLCVERRDRLFWYAFMRDDRSGWAEVTLGTGRNSTNKKEGILLTSQTSFPGADPKENKKPEGHPSGSRAMLGT